MQAIRYWRNDGVWLLRPGHKRHYGFHLVLLGHSLCGEQSPRTLKQPNGEMHVVRPWRINWTVMCVISLQNRSPSSRWAFRWMQSWLTSWQQSHERPWARTTHLSCSWAPGQQKLPKNVPCCLQLLNVEVIPLAAIANTELHWVTQNQTLTLKKINI